MRKTRRRLRAQPWDLFHPLPQMPTWDELPGPTKRRVTELLACLLRDHHEQKVLRATDKEAAHE